jgi:hypothetical protein
VLFLLDGGAKFWQGKRASFLDSSTMDLAVCGIAAREVVALVLKVRHVPEVYRDPVVAQYRPINLMLREYPKVPMAALILKNYEQD